MVDKLPPINTTLTGLSSLLTTSMMALVWWLLTSFTPKVESGKVVLMSTFKSGILASEEEAGASGYIRVMSESWSC